MANITIADFYTKYRAAGVYTVYRDQTGAPAINVTGTVRLVAGFSKTGPFNKLVFIDQGDYETAERLFGPDDTILEKNGSFFHKSLKICLEAGPVLALNLLKLQNQTEPINGQDPQYDADMVLHDSLSLSTGDLNGTQVNSLYASYYNKERFWSADRKYLLGTRGQNQQDYLFNLVNLSKTAASFLILKSDVTGFDITVREWYGSADIPPYLKPDDHISDYFIDVYCIDGNFGPARYTQLNTDPVYGEYFSTDGLIKSKLGDFLSRPEINTRFIQSGCLIPGFIDRRNNRYYIEDIINSGTNTHGVLCAIDTSQLDEFEFGTNTKGLDLVGHSLISSPNTDLDMLSYKVRLAQDFQYTEKTTNTTLTLDTTSDITITYGVGKVTVNVGSSNANFNSLKSAIELGDYVKGETTAAGTAAGITTANPILVVSKLTVTDSAVVMELTSRYKENETTSSGSLVNILIAVDLMTVEFGVSRFKLSTDGSYYIADIKTQIYEDWVAGKLTDGDKVIESGTTYYLKFTEVDALSSVDDADDYRRILKIDVYSDSDLTTSVGAGNAPDFGDTEDSNGYDITTSTIINFVSSIGNMSEKIAYSSAPSTNQVLVPIASVAKFALGDYLVGYDDDDNEILTRITSLVNVDTTGNDAIDSVRITTANDIKLYSAVDNTNTIYRFKPFEGFVTSYNMIYQPGFSIQKHHMPDGTNTRIREIYSVLTSSSMRDALIDPDMVNFRYFVDTFNGGIEPNSKNYLTTIFRDRQTCLGIINAPSASEFYDSTDPRFTDSPTAADPVPIFNTSYVKDGGNVSENPTFLYSLPKEVDGASFAGFFFPNINQLDVNKPSLPPAALVSNAFVRKFTNGEPFKVVANRRGVISSTVYQLGDPEYRLTSLDRGNLESKGINPIAIINGTTKIYGNQSAYQEIRSVLNDLHVRDMLISLQNDIQAILEPYVFEFNDDALRLEVSTLITNYLDNIQSRYSVLASFEVIFDRSNNPDEVVRENVAIVDVIIEPNSAVSRFINRFTLTKSGAPAAGGFVSI